MLNGIERSHGSLKVPAINSRSNNEVIIMFTVLDPQKSPESLAANTIIAYD